jgi:hypothetical protein
MVEKLESRLLLSNDGGWLGMNPGVAASQSTAVAAFQDLGLGVVREGLSKSDYTQTASGRSIDTWLANGIDPHVVLGARSFQVNQGSSDAEWAANFQAYCVDVMTYYHGKINYYIMGNEPDLSDPTTGNFTQDQTVLLTQAAYQAAQQVNTTYGTSIKLEGAVTSAPNLYTYLQGLINKGITRYCDYLGVHVYGTQIADGVLSLPWSWMENANQSSGCPVRPVVTSESGDYTGWAPTGLTDAQKRQWQTDWVAQWYVQMKRYGYSGGLLFDFDGSSASGDTGWGLVQDLSGNPIQPSRDEIKYDLNSSPFSNGGFESPNSADQWLVYDPNLADSTSLAGYFNFYAPGGRSGSALSVDVGSATAKQSLITRRVVGGLSPGVPVTITAYTYLTGANTAYLKAEGYNATDGLASATSNTNVTGTWHTLTVTITPTNPWVVLELSTSGTGVAGNSVKFDDVSVWSSNDIGAVAAPGSASFNPSTQTWTVNGAGDIWTGESHDWFQFTSQPFNGNGQLLATITSLTLPGTSGSRAGVMFRDGLGVGAAYASMILLRNSASAYYIDFQWRGSQGAASSWSSVNVSGVPQWVKLVRSDNTFSGYYSSDGTTWTQIGTAQAITMGVDAQAGLAVCSHASTVSTATFTNVSLEALGTPLFAANSQSATNVRSDGSYTVGQLITVGSTDQTVSALGAQGVDSDGTLSGNFQDGAAGVQVGIWNAGGTALLASATVTPSNSALGADGYRYTSITPVTLLAGQQYLIGVLVGHGVANFVDYSSSSWVNAAGGFTIANDVFHTGSTLSAPLSNGGGSPTRWGPASLLSSPTPGSGDDWASRDVGSPNLAGSSVYNSTTQTWTVNGSGADIWGASDQFQFASQTFTGDGQIVARVISQTNTNPWAKAGVMLRDGMAANGMSILVDVTPSNGVNMQWRASTGGVWSNTQVTGVTAPRWVKIIRSSNTYSGYYSSDGITWIQIGTTQTIAMPAAIQAGLAVTSVDNTKLCTATFTNVSVGNGFADGDIGSPALAGSVGYNSLSRTWTLNGSGADIGGTSDQFNFASRSRAGDATIITRVDGLTNTNSGAKAGVMFRDGMAANAAFVDVVVTPGNGVCMQWRTAAGTTAQSSASITGLAAPVWLKLVRTGNSFSGYYSVDGIFWTQIGTSQTVVMASTAQVGLVITAHTNSLLATAMFDSVSIM